MNRHSFRFVTLRPLLFIYCHQRRVTSSGVDQGSAASAFFFADLAGSFKYLGLRQDAVSWIMQQRRAWGLGIIGFRICRVQG